MTNPFPNIKADVITFDVFDTLIIRNVVKPIDVFDMVGGKTFRYARIAAEILSRKLSKKEDITLDEIYRFLPSKFKAKEIETEKEVCKENPQVYALYKELKAQGKRIYAISDMYLPKEVISDILKNCGYKLDGLYVSSDIGLSKTTGNLFRYFLKENNLRPEDVLHIGDNTISDFECAKQIGTDAIHIEKHSNKLTYLKKNKDCYLKGFVNHILNNTTDRFEQLGYEVLGPVLVSFCQWIHRKKVEFGIEKLFFMSRDMHIVFDAYKMMYPKENIAYIQISRKSLHNAKGNSEFLCKYLQKSGCVGKVAVVDTGWRCAAQPIIEYYAKLVQPDSDIGGLYLGTKTGYNYISRSKNSASCFYRTKSERIKSQTYSSLIECLLGYNENKTVDYDINGDPIFNTENKNIGKIEDIQKAALKFVENWFSETGNRFIKPKNAFSPYIKIQNAPLSEDINLLGNLDYDDVITSHLVNYEKSVFCSPVNWLKNLRLSAWKGAYFKKSFKFYKPFYWGYLFLDSLYLSFIDIKTFKNKDINFLLDFYK